jgi:hypothetical protein
MARLNGLDGRAAGWNARFVYWLAKRKVGRVPEPVTIYAHHPNLLRGYGAFEMFLERAKKVDARLKNLASLKVAALVGCPF